MPWNPEIYNQFKTIRYQPFYDLSDLISVDNLKNCIDVGCGTGEQTAILANKFDQANFLGIDSSKEMLEKSKEFDFANLSFQQQTIEEFSNSDTKWDLIFSNAALQWSDNHKELFPKLISKLSDNGQFAVQMPCQKENVLNVILSDLAREKPFADYLNDFHLDSSLLTIDDYAKIMFDNGLKNLNISMKVYPIYGNNEIEFFNFISGSALIPYMERLTTEQQELFTTEFKTRIKKYYKTFPALYSFKRILLYGRKS
ncbi:methyltransferase domain-containing protein [Empedobacter sedimenti]|uniref:methyltransferase domain-containing protein n=1 Tax=Empedobacter sedimenti TaxID=3042610 RepID=UPI0024A6B5BE|nr:methyltransferase domain-containing protein [Empedobacter sedimenti]